MPESRPAAAPFVPVEPAPTAQSGSAVYAAGANIGQGRNEIAAAMAVTLRSPAPAGGDLREELRGQLRDPAAVRRAILLREILGEPKGLQSMESLSIFSPL
jgi:hypothetical protein